MGGKMEIMEIVLLIAGSIIFVLSFFIPERKGTSGSMGSSAENEVKALVSQELEALRDHVEEVVEEAVSYAMEKTERSLERLSNEKIMAVNEYSDTVLSEIHKNHEEAMFLYDMLNNKHTSLKNTVAEINATIKDAEERIRAFQQPAPGDPVSDRKFPEESLFGDKQEEEAPEVMDTSEKWMKALNRQDELSEESGSQELNNNEKIRKLYKQGKSAIAIARELGLGIGEVRLVIDLFRNQKA